MFAEIVLGNAILKLRNQFPYTLLEILLYQ